MLSSPFLETIISLILIVLIFSILVTCVQEGYVSIVKSRGKMLEKSIGEVLNDSFNKNYAYLLYQHPQIDLLKQKQGALPSYIEGETFARALIDLIAKESTEIIYTPSENGLIKSERFIQPILEKSQKEADKWNVQHPSGPKKDPEFTWETEPNSVNLAIRFRLGTESLHYSDLKKLLLSFLANVSKTKPEHELKALKTQVQTWYDNYMDRVTGWYKRKVKVNLFFAAVIVTMTFNLNFISLAKNIYADTKLRNSLTQVAENFSQEENPIARLQQQLTKDSLILKNIDVDALVGTELPIGWNFTIKDFGADDKSWLGAAFSYVGYFFNNHFKLVNVFGWIISIMALSLGSSFWFDVLKKLVNIRSTGIAPEQKDNQ